MNSKTEYQLYKVAESIWFKSNVVVSFEDALRYSEPLKWYISTGRCSGEFIRKFNNLTKSQIATVARRTKRAYCENNDYDYVIGYVLKYIDKLP